MDSVLTVEQRTSSLSLQVSGVWEFDPASLHVLCGLGEAHDCVPRLTSVSVTAVLQEYGVPRLLL